MFAMPGPSIHFDLEELISLKPYYVVPEYFYEPFYEVAGRLASLQRFFHVNLKTTRAFMSESRQSYMLQQAKAGKPKALSDMSSDEIGGWLDELAHGDITLQDMDFYFDFLYAAMLAQLFSILEKLLLDVIRMVQQDLKIADE